MKPYVVVLKARASAVFYPGDQFVLTCRTQQDSSCILNFRTTYDLTTKFDASPPADLWVEARGQCENLHEAVESFGNAAMEINTIIALSVNAFMGALQPEIAFDEQADCDEHEFFQAFMPDAPRILIPGRRIDVEVVEALVRKLAVHRERQRLLRAAAQYVEALQFWRLGRELSCVAHLYMCAEALTKAMAREYLLAKKTTQEELGLEWGIDAESTNKANRFDSEVRRRLIFDGDTATYETAKAVSDGFEHGFRDFAEIRKPATEVIVKMAGYLRRAIIELTGIDQLTERALGSEYAIPRGPLFLMRYVYGTLIGKPGELAPKGSLYPSLTWSTKVKNVLLNENRRYSFVPDENLTARLGDGVSLQLTRFEVWDGSTIQEAQSPPTAPASPAVQVNVTEAGSREEVQHKLRWWQKIIRALKSRLKQMTR
jgi:hypothetical protein